MNISKKTAKCLNVKMPANANECHPGEKRYGVFWLQMSALTDASLLHRYLHLYTFLLFRFIFFLKSSNILIISTLNISHPSTGVYFST